MVTNVRERGVSDGLSEHLDSSEKIVFSPEPIATFLFPNGKGGFRKKILSLSKIEREIQLLRDEKNKLVLSSVAIERKLKTLGEKRRKHGGGSRSRREMADIRRQMSKERKKVEGQIATAKTKIGFFQRARNIVRTSTPEAPLEIRPAAGGKIELFIDGKQLSEEEVEWREFIGEFAPTLWEHPQMELMRKVYFLQKAAYTEWKEQRRLEGPAQSRWERFRDKHTDKFPEESEVAEFMAQITKKFSRYQRS